MSQNLSIVTPLSEGANEFSGLNDEVKREVWLLLDAMKIIVGSKRRKAGFAAAARAIGRKEKTVSRLYYEWVHSGHDWRVFVDGRKAAVGEDYSSQDVEIFRQWVGENKRKCRPAWEAMVRAWKRGEIKTSTPINIITGIPRGWSYENLMRKKPAAAQLTAIREGLGAAITEHVQKVLKTRFGLYVGSHYMPDDVLRDFQVLLISGTAGRKARVGELGVLDLYSADRFAVFRRPVYEDDSGKRVSFKEREMRFLVAAVLRNQGYSPRGTVWPAELGTAAIRKPLAKFLHGASSGLVTVQDPGLLGGVQALAGLVGRGKGNPRHKAALESHHNLLQNVAGSLLGQTGHDRNPPEFLFGFEQSIGKVAELLSKLPPEKAELLRFHGMEYWQACAFLNELDQIVAHRTDHDLEAWEKCGHACIEYRHDLASDEWISQEEMLALPEGKRMRLLAAVDALPLGVVTRPRKMSPREVWARGAGELVTLPDHVIALMFCDRELGDDLRETRQPNAEREFVLDRSEVEPDPMHFRGALITPEGGELRVEPGASYGVVVNPFDRERLWVFDKKGGYLGAAPRRTRARPDDVQAIEVQLGQRAQDIAAITGPLRERHAGISAAIREVQEHNADVVASRTPQDKARLKAARSVKGSLEDFVAPPASSSSTKSIESTVSEEPINLDPSQFL